MIERWKFYNFALSEMYNSGCIFHNNHKTDVSEDGDQYFF